MNFQVYLLLYWFAIAFFVVVIMRTPAYHVRMKLYRMIAEIELFVLARNKQEAEQVGARNINREVMMDNHRTSVDIVTELSQHWKAVLPYRSITLGDIPDKTCQECLEEI